MIAVIAAVARNGVIGRYGRLPWHYPADLKHFALLTEGKTLVMGRKTYESLPLERFANRSLVVLTRQADYAAPNAIACNSVPSLLQHIAPLEQVYVIGGASLYELFLPMAQRAHISVIPESPHGDAFFPSGFPGLGWLPVSAKVLDGGVLAACYARK